ncbi:MAG: helix-turn-helix transcriptional regulator [Mariprofundaceae bacterium]
MDVGNNKKSLAQRIKKARIAAGLSQSELARILEIKPQAIQHWERGTSSPKTSRIADLAVALNVQASWLLFEETNINQVHGPEIVAYGELNIDEQILIKTYRQMDLARQQAFNEIAETFAQHSAS